MAGEHTWITAGQCTPPELIHREIFGTENPALSIREKLLVETDEGQLLLEVAAIKPKSIQFNWILITPTKVTSGSNAFEPSGGEDNIFKGLGFRCSFDSEKDRAALHLKMGTRYALILKDPEGDQAGAGKPATAPEPKPGGNQFADAFADFRAEVKGKVPVGWVCGEIRTFEGQTGFDVSSPKNKFAVVITQHDLISQQEWTRRAERMKQTIDSFIAGKDPETGDDLWKWMNLPDGRFGKTAVEVSLSEPDIYQPEYRTDEEEASRVVQAILGILKPYDKGEKAGAGPPAAPPESKPEGSQNPQPKSKPAPR